MGLGMPEVVLILVIALIVFGPRKLPELGKSLGQAMNQFRRASDEFKRTWEQEVEHDKISKEISPTTTASDHEPGYSADSDYQYGYDTTANGDDHTATESADAAPQAEAKAETPKAAIEQKAEPQWI